MQIWAESGKSALPICNYSQILYQFLTFTQNLKRSHLISSEQIACINFLFYIIKAAVITVGNDRMGSCFELFKIIDNFTAEECITVL